MIHIIKNKMKIKTKLLKMMIYLTENNLILFTKFFLCFFLFLKLKFKFFQISKKSYIWINLLSFLFDKIYSSFGRVISSFY